MWKENSGEKRDKVRWRRLREEEAKEKEKGRG